LAAFQAPADRELLLDQTTALPAAAGLAVRVDTRSGWCDSRPLGSVLTATRCARAASRQEPTKMGEAVGEPRLVAPARSTRPLSQE